MATSKIGKGAILVRSDSAGSGNDFTLWYVNTMFTHPNSSNEKLAHVVRVTIVDDWVSYYDSVEYLSTLEAWLTWESKTVIGSGWAQFVTLVNSIIRVHLPHKYDCYALIV